MRIVIATDKFKGCLSAAEVASAMATGLRRGGRLVEVDLCPMADGGEGTVAALVAATNGKLLSHRVTGPLPDTLVDAAFGLLGSSANGPPTAVVEMAAASGLHLLRPEQRNPMLTTTYGTGQLLVAARDAGARRIILGIGGSATVDAGLGCAQACGVEITLKDGTARTAGDRPLCGEDVGRVGRVVRERSLLGDISITVACDVANGLFGVDGAAAVFGPQKGATPGQVQQLDEALEALAERLDMRQLAESPGAGAAGGLGFAMLAFFGAALRPGIGMVMEAANLRERLRKADLCITGEGRLDGQTLCGKAPLGVARLCREVKVPCIAIAGTIDETARPALAEHFAEMRSLQRPGLLVEECIGDAARLLAAAGEAALRDHLARSESRRSGP